MSEIPALSLRASVQPRAVGSPWFALVCLFVLTSANLYAGGPPTPEATFSIADQSTDPDDPFDVTVTLNPNVSVGAVGYSVVHDPAVVTPISGSPGPDFPAPAYFGFTIVTDPPVGIIGGVVPDFTLQDVFPARVDSEFLVITYEVVAGVTSASTIVDFQDFAGGTITENSAITPFSEFCTLTLVEGTVSIAEIPEFLFRRGDCDGNGTSALSDVIALLAVLFSGSVATCEQACDANGDDAFSLGDPIALLAFLFQGEMLPPPTDDCGPTDTGAALTCASPTVCP